MPPPPPALQVPQEAAALQASGVPFGVVPCLDVGAAESLLVMEGGSAAARMSSFITLAGG